MNTIRKFFEEENLRKREQQLQELTPADEEAEYQRCLAINEEWNAGCAKIRDARIEKYQAEKRVYVKERLEAKKIRQKIELEAIEEKIRQEKERSATYITRDKIDQAIEAALANPTDFNFSIDLQGKMYKNTERPDKVEKTDP